MEQPARYLLLLGSNLDREESVPRAQALLEEELTVLATSSCYESEPVGAPDTPLFFNRALLTSADTTPEGLKARLRALEARLGRVRDGNPNAPRTIDIDIICVIDADGRVRSDPPPDPDLFRYHHVAVPAAEIAGEVRLPDGARLAGLPARLGAWPRGLRVIPEDPTNAGRSGS